MTVHTFITGCARDIVSGVLHIETFAGTWNEADVALVRALVEQLHRLLDEQQIWSQLEPPF